MDGEPNGGQKADGRETEADGGRERILSSDAAISMLLACLKIHVRRIPREITGLLLTSHY